MPDSRKTARALVGLCIYGGVCRCAGCHGYLNINAYECKTIGSVPIVKGATDGSESMDQQIISQQWRELNNEKRDILVALAVDGPASGADIHRRLRGNEPQTEGTTHRNLQTLLDWSLVSRESVDGRENRYQLTDDGHNLVQQGVVIPADTI